jgi:hypothetical protein
LYERKIETSNVSKRIEKKLTSIRLPGRKTQNNIPIPPINNGNENGRKTMFHTWLVDLEICEESSFISSRNLGRVLAVVINTNPTLIGTNKSKFISVPVVTRSIPQCNINKMIESDRKMASIPFL